MNSDEKKELAFYIATQFIRTKSARENVNEGLSKLIKEVGEKFLDLDDIQISYDKELIKLLHEEILINPEMIQSIAQSITDYIWRIYINKTNIPFWTSDTPVSLKATKGLKGIAAQGIEVLLPLSPAVMLIMTERRSLVDSIENKGEIEHNDLRYVSLTKEQDVIDMNVCQVDDSYRFLFSNQDDFDLAKWLILLNPELNSPRQRFIVE